MHDEALKTYLKVIGKNKLLTAEEEVTLAKEIEAGLLALERLERLSGSSVATDTDMFNKLNILVQNGIAAKERFINSNLRLVVSVAARYRDRGLEFEELIAEGNFGLIRAVEKYDYMLGYKFSTYATWWIKQAITRAIANQSNLIRIPVHMYEKISKVRAAISFITSNTGHNPTASEIAEHLGYDVVEVEGIKEIIRAQKVYSLEHPLSAGDENGVNFGHIIEDDQSEDYFLWLEQSAIHDDVMAIFNNLSDKERGVIGMRLGLGGQETKTLEEIGQAYGLTRERIRLIANKAFSKLAHPSRGLAAISERGDIGWQIHALCSQVDPDLFFPNKGGSTRDAKSICDNCVVKQECLDYALSRQERFGIWGGLSERERRPLDVANATVMNNSEEISRDDDTEKVS